MSSTPSEQSESLSPDMPGLHTPDSSDQELFKPALQPKDQKFEIKAASIARPVLDISEFGERPCCNFVVQHGNVNVHSELVESLSEPLGTEILLARIALIDDEENENEIPSIRLKDVELSVFAAFYEFAMCGSHNNPKMTERDTPIEDWCSYDPKSLKKRLLDAKEVLLDPKMYFKSKLPLVATEVENSRWCKFLEQYDELRYSDKKPRNPMFHVKMYCFAKQFRIATLLEYSLLSLSEDLRHFIISAETLPYLLSLIEHAYKSSPRAGVVLEDRLRVCFSEYLAEHYLELSEYRGFQQLLDGNGELASDVIVIIARNVKESALYNKNSTEARKKISTAAAVAKVASPALPVDQKAPNTTTNQAKQPDQAASVSKLQHFSKKQKEAFKAMDVIKTKLELQHQEPSKEQKHAFNKAAAELTFTKKG